MGSSHFERIEIPKSSAAPVDEGAFQSKFCHDFHAAKGKVGAEIVSVGQDRSYENATVLCLKVRGTPSEQQTTLLKKYSPKPA